MYTSEGFDATFSLPLTGTELVLQSCGLALGPDNSPWDLFLRSHLGLCDKMQVETVGHTFIHSLHLHIHCVHVQIIHIQSVVHTLCTCTTIIMWVHIFILLRNNLLCKHFNKWVDLRHENNTCMYIYSTCTYTCTYI